MNLHRSTYLHTCMCIHIHISTWMLTPSGSSSAEAVPGRIHPGRLQPPIQAASVFERSLTTLMGLCVV